MATNKANPYKLNYAVTLLMNNVEQVFRSTPLDAEKDAHGLGMLISSDRPAEGALRPKAQAPRKRRHAARRRPTKGRAGRPREAPAHSPYEDGTLGPSPVAGAAPSITSLK